MEPLDFGEPVRRRRNTQNRMPVAVWFFLGIAFMGAVAGGVYLWFRANPRSDVNTVAASLSTETPEAAYRAIEGYIEDGRFDLVWNRMAFHSRNFWVVQSASEQKAKDDFISLQKGFSSGNRPKLISVVETANTDGHAKLKVTSRKADGKQVSRERRMVFENGQWKLDVLGKDNLLLFQEP